MSHWTNISNTWIKTFSLPRSSSAHMRASMWSLVGAGSSTLNHGGDLPLLQQVPSQFTPFQSGSLEYTIAGTCEVGFLDSQYQLLLRKEGGETPGLLEQGQVDDGIPRPSLHPAVNVQRC